MPKTLTEVTRGAAELSRPERLKLARLLLEMSQQEPGSTTDVEEAWDKEIESRLQELRSGGVKGVPLEEVKRNIERRFVS